jgi:hypothetical protein
MTLVYNWYTKMTTLEYTIYYLYTKDIPLGILTRGTMDI